MVQKQIVNINFSKLFIPFFSIAVFLMMAVNPAFAGGTVSDLTETIVTNTSQLPGLLTGLSYLLGLVFGVNGIIKMKEHVENPNGTALRYPVISLAIGGSLFSLPIVYEAMTTAINGGAVTNFDPSQGPVAGLSGLAGNLLSFGQVFGHILGNIADSVETVPGIVTAFAYMLGLIFGVSGLLKIKEHVEEPSRTPVKEGVMRLLLGGALFAIPTVYDAIYNAVSDGGGIFSAFALTQMLATTTGTTTEGGTCLTSLFSNTLGGVVCKLFASTTPMTAFLTAMAYLFGLFVGIWGILKIKDHVENPSQTPAWDPISKFLVAGGLFALPNVVTIAFNTVAALIAPHSNTLNGQTQAVQGPLGLDGMIAALMNDTFVPVTALVNWFGLAAGFILIFIGITRLMKSAQEGPRGPGGIGTLMTFVTGGALAAFSPMVTSLSASMFAAEGVRTTGDGKLRYTAGMDKSAIDRAETVIDSIILFVMLLGFISIARGIFIMRGVAEGNSQASSMAGVTHLVGGALAVNLGPLLNAVQVTLGIDALGLGIVFN